MVGIFGGSFNGTNRKGFIFQGIVKITETRLRTDYFLQTLGNEMNISRRPRLSKTKLEAMTAFFRSIFFGRDFVHTIFTLRLFDVVLIHVRQGMTDKVCRYSLWGGHRNKKQ